MQKDKLDYPKLNILAFGAHPDDVEAGCAGFLLNAKKAGQKSGVIDLSLAELSTNGTVPQRQKEAKAAAKVLGAAVRENLKLPNNFFFNSKKVQEKIIEVIRKYRPEIMLLPYHIDRHPDHQETPKLVWQALFTGGLSKFKTNLPPHRPKYVFFYRLWFGFKPTFLLDISDVFDKKIKSILCYKSQFLNRKNSRPTKDNDDSFLDYWRSRHRADGYDIGVKYAEPYLSLTPLGLKDLNAVLPNYL